MDSSEFVAPVVLFQSLFIELNSSILLLVFYEDFDLPTESCVLI